MTPETLLWIAVRRYVSAKRCKASPELLSRIEQRIYQAVDMLVERDLEIL